MNADLRQRLAGVAFFAVPIVLVKLIALTFSVEGPQGARATEPVRPKLLTVEPSPPPAVPTDAEECVRAALDAIRDKPFARSPLVDAAEPAPEPTPLSNGPATVNDALDVRISAIMASSRGAIALIDGKPRRVGDSVHEGWWTITNIDVNARSVTFTHASNGRTVTRAVPGPR